MVMKAFFSNKKIIENTKELIFRYIFDVKLKMVFRKNMFYRISCKFITNVTKRNIKSSENLHKEFPKLIYVVIYLKALK